MTLVQQSLSLAFLVLLLTLALWKTLPFELAGDSGDCRLYRCCVGRFRDDGGLVAAQGTSSPVVDAPPAG